MSRLGPAHCLVVVACLSACAQQQAPPAENPLEIDIDSPSFVDEALRARVSESPHALFRFINVPFSREVCRRIEPIMPSLPTVNLHGDAHLEQIAVTGHGAGLADFDDSASGPPVLDLVRFGVSITLTLEQRGWAQRRSDVAARFVDSYRRGLTNSEPAPPTPACVERMRPDANGDPLLFLTWSESQMGSMPERARTEVEQGFARYVKLMLDIHPQLTSAFFELKRWGMLRGGIGSANTLRYLARIEGPSPDPADDIILEAKELRNLDDVPCIVAQRGNALRVVAGSVRFGRRPDPYLAVIPRGADEDSDDPPWWMQSWDPNYRELDILSSLRSREELVELVEAVGFQMAQGHTNVLPPPYDRQLGEMVAVMLEARDGDILRMIDELTGMVIAAHSTLGRQLESS